MSAPHWMTATLGGKRLRNSGVDEVLEPWWVTFNYRQGTGIRTVCHVLLLVRLGVAGEQDAGCAVGQQDGHGVVVDLGEQTAFGVRRRSYNIGPHPSPVHQRPGPQDLHLGPLIAYTAQERVVRQGVVRVARDVDGLHRESVEHVEEAADVVRVRVANHESSIFVEREAPTSNGPPNTPVTSTDPSEKAITFSRIIL